MILWLVIRQFRFRVIRSMGLHPNSLFFNYCAYLFRYIAYTVGIKAVHVILLLPIYFINKH